MLGLCPKQVIPWSWIVGINCQDPNGLHYCLEFLLTSLNPVYQEVGPETGSDSLGQDSNIAWYCVIGLPERLIQLERQRICRWCWM